MSSSGDSAIDDYILESTGRTYPKVCFVPTAGGDSADYIRRFEKAFASRASTSVLSLFDQDPWGYSDPSMLLKQDVIYVGGGSTANLLALWRLHRLPPILRKAAAEGTVLAGISAGANCWFEAPSTDSFGALAPLNDGLGFLSGSMCPHYLGEPERRSAYLDWVGQGRLPEGYAVDDGAALRFDDGELTRVVTEQPEAPAYRVHRIGDRAVEQLIPSRSL